jgi:uncharacterized protein (TIGR04222 family)
VALDLHEVAYLCGGPERVAHTAVVTMERDGRIKISPARHRVQVARDQASHPVERAVLDAAPWPGLGSGPSDIDGELRNALKAPDLPLGSLVPEQRAAYARTVSLVPRVNSRYAHESSGNLG